MPESHDTATVAFDEDLWDLVVVEAEHAGVSVSDYVRDAVIARIIAGPTDPRIFELFAGAVRERIRSEPPSQRTGERGGRRRFRRA
jgi:hypothetical protein